MSTLNSLLCGYQPPQNMLSVGFPQTVGDIRPDNRLNALSIAKESDLVSLSWLQKGNILQITPLDNEEDPSRDVPHVLDGSFGQSFRICDPSVTFTTTGSRIAIPTSPAISSPYVSSTYCQNLTKPCYSYTHLIFMAIESTPAKCMTVNQIYNWCETNFPFYKHAGAGWKNSLRHNLSINKSFKRLPRDGRVSCFKRICFISFHPSYFNTLH